MAVEAEAEAEAEEGAEALDKTKSSRTMAIEESSWSFVSKGKAKETAPARKALNLSKPRSAPVRRAFKRGLHTVKDGSISLS